VSGTQPDIIHVHEWQTSVLPLLYWDMYHRLSLKASALAWYILIFLSLVLLTCNSITDVLFSAETKNSVDNPQHGALWGVPVFHFTCITCPIIYSRPLVALMSDNTTVLTVH